MGSRRFSPFGRTIETAATFFGKSATIFLPARLLPVIIWSSLMQVAKNAVVTIDYTLKNPEGNVIDTSVGRQPLPYIHGTGSLISGLEKALEGKKAGDQIIVTVPPEEGYGIRDEKLVSKHPKSSFGNNPITVGAQFRAQAANGAQQVVTITRIDTDSVTADANHPLAGIPLNFDVTIKEVREATKDELAHGHVHGPGGHHHH
jgi:FKBP-type peptidyl-prolyl cis-trans isomerase SlyD